MGLSPLERALWRTTALAWCGVFAAGAGAACVRLLPWLMSPDVPRAVVAEFARALVAVAGEAAYVLGLPLGAALASALLRERGEARALFALGVSPFQILMRTWRSGLLLVAAFGAVSWGVGKNPASAGSFANQLLEAGRTSCAAALRPSSATVPLLDVSWLCVPGRTPRLVGTVAGKQHRVWFTAEDATVHAALTQVTLQRAELAWRPEGSERGVRVRVAEARVSGLHWPGERAGSGRGARVLAALLSGLSAALVAMGATLRFGFGGRLFATALAAAGGAAALAGLQAFNGKGVLLLVLPPLFGAAAPLMLIALACVWGRLHPRSGRT